MASNTLTSCNEKLKQILKEIEETETKLSDTLNLIELKQKELDSIDTMKVKEINRLKEEKLKELLEPYEKVLKEIDEAIKKKKSEQFNIPDEELRKKYVKDYFQIEDLDKVLSYLEKQIQKKLKVEDLKFSDKLDIRWLQSNVGSILSNYKDIRKNLKYYTTIDFKNFHELIDLLISPPKVLGEVGIAIYGLYLLTIFAVIIDKFPLVLTSFLVIICTIGLTLFFKTNKLFKLYKEVKVLQDNLPALYDFTDRNLDKVKKGLIEEFEKDKSDDLESLQIDLENNKEKIEEIKAQPCDIEGVDETFKNNFDRLQEDIKFLNKRKTSLQNSLDSLKKKLEDIKRALQKALDKIVSYEVKDDVFILPKDILIESSPFQSIELKRDLMVFRYDDFESYEAFLKLFVGQILMNINPFSINIRVFDRVRMGMDILSFFMNNGILRIYSDDQEIIKEQVELLTNYNRRMSDIRGHQSLDDYNEYMLSIDSITREYQLLLYIEPDDSLLKNINLERLKNIAPLSGMIPIIFIDNNMTEDIQKALAKYPNNNYLISKGTVKPVPGVKPPSRKLNI